MVGADDGNVLVFAIGWVCFAGIVCKDGGVRVWALYMDYVWLELCYSIYYRFFLRHYVAEKFSGIDMENGGIGRVRLGLGSENEYFMSLFVKFMRERGDIFFCSADGRIPVMDEGYFHFLIRWTSLIANCNFGIFACANSGPDHVVTFFYVVVIAA